MSVAEDNLAVAMLRFEQCREAIEPLLEIDDPVAVIEVEEEFRSLRDRLRAFARHHHGIGAPRRKNR